MPRGEENLPSRLASTHQPDGWHDFLVSVLWQRENEGRGEVTSGMTFDDDSVRLNFVVGPVVIPCTKLGLEWPPPERLYISDEADIREATNDDDPRYVMRRVSYSQISDEDRAEMTHVFRGAEYEYETDTP